jgi:hypothetical protein
MSARKPWYEQPEPKFVRRRSAEEYAAVAAAVELLPTDHPARKAFAEGVDTIALTHLCSGYPDVIEALCTTYIEGCGRLLQHRATFTPWPVGTSSSGDR